jgi:hypothetical protein
MRILLAVALILAGASALEARQAGKAKRYYYGPPNAYYYSPPKDYYYGAPRGASECERRAWAEDPSGQYAGYPCWARQSFGRGGGGRGR